MGSRFVHITAEWKLALEVMRTSVEEAVTVAVGVIFCKLSIENCKTQKSNARSRWPFAVQQWRPKPPINTSYHHHHPTSSPTHQERVCSQRSYASLWASGLDGNKSCEL
jgi:hypothetical protein